MEEKLPAQNEYDTDIRLIRFATDKLFNTLKQRDKDEMSDIKRIVVNGTAMQTKIIYNLKENAIDS